MDCAGDLDPHPEVADADAALGGQRVVYVRFAPKEPTLTMNVRGE